MAEPLVRCPYCPWEDLVRSHELWTLDDMHLAEHLVLNHAMRSESLVDFIGERRERYVAKPPRRTRAVAPTSVGGTDG